MQFSYCVDFFKVVSRCVIDDWTVLLLHCDPAPGLLHFFVLERSQTTYCKCMFDTTPLAWNSSLKL